MNDERQERDDELLSAYLDGELPQAEADELTRRLAREPALAARLEAMRAMDEAAIAAFRTVDERPMPERVLELLAEPDEAAPRRDKVIALRPRRTPGDFVRLPAAIAAGVALAAGIWLGRLTVNGGASDAAVYAGRIAEGSGLYAAFDRTASGESVAVGGGLSAEPVLTFRSSGGDWCRQVRVTGPAPADALACRRDGEWQVRLVSFDAGAPVPGEAPYGQASTGGAAAIRAAIDDLMGPAPPLAPAEEAEVIDRGWQRGRE